MRTQLSELSDEDLMLLYQQGNHPAFEEIYARYASRVYGFLRKRLQRKESIEDIYQNVFLKIHKSRETYSKNYLLSQWIFVVTRTVMIDCVAKERLINKVSEIVSGDVTEQPANNGPYLPVDGSDLAPYLENIAVPQKFAVELRVLEDYSYQDIALKLGISPSNARQLVSRGLKHLRALFVKPKNGKGEAHEW